MAYLFQPALQPAVDVNGDRVSGAYWLFTLTGTTVLTPVYTDETGGTELTNPVIADAQGEFPNIFLEEDISYRARLFDANDISMGVDADPITPVYPGDLLEEADLANRAIIVPDRTALAALPDDTEIAYLSETGRSGIFKWVSEVLTNLVTKDTEQGIYVPPASDTTGASGAWVRQYDGPWNIKWFGATGVGNSHDDRPALVGALNLLQSTSFGHATQGSSRTIYFPASKSYYYLSDTVEIAKPVILKGDGADPNSAEYSSYIKVPGGVTAFYFTRKSGIGTADGWKIEDLGIEALGSNSNTGLASHTYSSRIITIAAAGDWQNADLILIRGAGAECTYANSDYWFAACTSGSPTITVTGPPFSSEIALAVGMHGQVRNRNTAVAAFPAGTYITAISGLTITMSANATATETAGKLHFFEDQAFVIDSGAGTTTLTLNDFPRNSAGFTSHVMEHYDSAIYSESRGTLAGQVATGNFAKGAGWFIHANATLPNRYGQDPNANQSRQYGEWWSYGNRNGHRAQGNDANQCSFLGFDGYLNSEFQYVDASFLGNQLHGAHVSQNLGYISTNPNARSTFLGCYTEGGTNNVFAECAVIMGGFMGAWEGNVFGGVHYGANVGAGALPPSHLYPPLSSLLNVLQGSSNLDHGILAIDNSGRGGSTGISYMRYAGAADGHAGIWGSFDNDSSRWGPGFTDAGHSRGAGLSVHPQGLLIGSGGNITNPFRKEIYGTAAPASGTWVQGDHVKNSIIAVGQPKGWFCTVGGTPGTWVADSNL